MDNNTMRTANAQTAIDLLKQTFLNVLHDAKVKGQPLLSPSEISKQLGISQVADNGLSKSILSMLESDNLVECVFSSNQSKYKLID